MSAPDHTYQRLIEDAIVTLLKASTVVNYTYTDQDGKTYAPAILRRYQQSTEAGRLSVVVHAKDLTNAMLGATGRGSQWRVTLSLGVVSVVAHDKDNENADQLQGAVERYLAALTPATINTQLGVGSVVTIHGITSAEDPDQMTDDRETLWRYSAVTLHFGVT